MNPDTEISAHDQARWERHRQRAVEQLTNPPIILGGCGRSGTTLLLSIISAHPQVLAIPNETNCFCPRGYQESVDTGDPIETDLSFYRHFDNVTWADTHTRWCEKTPRNVLFFQRLIDHFGGHVRLIQIVRDGRDVVLSRHPVNRDKYWVAIERWVNDVQAGLAIAEHPLVHTVRYEELVRDNDQAVRRICAFLDLPVTDQMRNWHQHATVRENPAWDGKVKPLFESSIGKWRQPDNAERVAELMDHPTARQLLEQLGYLDESA